jgi:hypothetical protein
MKKLPYLIIFAALHSVLYSAIAVAQINSSPFAKPGGAPEVAAKPAAAKATTTNPAPAAAQKTAQPPENPYEKEYKQRIKKTELDGVYIPKDLADALAQLDKLISAESQEKFKTVGEEKAVHHLYFSLGRWIWVNWSLTNGSRLSEYFRQCGVRHPEDMSMLIIRSYHRHLNGKDLDFKEQMQTLRATYAKEDEERQERARLKLEKETGKPVQLKPKE